MEIIDPYEWVVADNMLRLNNPTIYTKEEAIERAEFLTNLSKNSIQFRIVKLTKGN